MQGNYHLLLSVSDRGRNGKIILLKENGTHV